MSAVPIPDQRSTSGRDDKSAEKLGNVSASVECLTAKAIMYPEFPFASIPMRLRWLGI